MTRLHRSLSEVHRRPIRPRIATGTAIASGKPAEATVPSNREPEAAANRYSGISNGPQQPAH